MLFHFFCPNFIGAGDTILLKEKVQGTEVSAFRKPLLSRNFTQKPFRIICCSKIVTL